MTARCVVCADQLEPDAVDVCTLCLIAARLERRRRLQLVAALDPTQLPLRPTAGAS